MSLPSRPRFDCSRTQRTLQRIFAHAARHRLASLLVLTLVLVLTAIGALSHGGSAATSPDDPWLTTAMQRPRTSHSATMLPGGRVFVAGGWDGATTLASAELYDEGADVWLNAASMSAPRSFHTASLLPNGRVLVAGGWETNGQSTASAELYDVMAGTWTVTSPMQIGRAGHVAVVLNDGRVLVAGGCAMSIEGAMDVIAPAELYDGSEMTWESAGSMLTPRCWHTATLLPDGRVLVIGGRDVSGASVASAEIYDPTSNSWTSTTAMASPRRDHTATLLPDGTVLVAGGYSGIEYLANAETYDPLSNRWQSAGSMSAARASHTATLLRNGEVLVGGGADGTRQNDSAEAYMPESRTWTSAGSLGAPYESHHAMLLSNDRVLVIGQPNSADVVFKALRADYGSQQSPGPALMMPTPTSESPETGDGKGAAGNVLASNASDVAGEVVASSTFAPPSSNYTTDTNTATLFGVHEIAIATAPTLSNPYDRKIVVTFTLPQTPVLAEEPETLTVDAFYDGTLNNLETWRARVYVNRLGAWKWTAFENINGGLQPIGTEKTFIAGESVATEDEKRPRGMLHVAPETPTVAQARVTPAPGLSGESDLETLGTPKRWYTDDGRAFAPMADTAYRLFWDQPDKDLMPDPGEKPCKHTDPANPYDPTRLVMRGGNQVPLWQAHVQDMAAKGINVLRALSLGNWIEPTPDEWCPSSFRLYFDDNPTPDFFSEYDFTVPLSAAEQARPNQVSLQRTDERLAWLLNNYPNMYIELILLPEMHPYDEDDNDWFGLGSPNRQRLWRTMLARWGAFPNVFWTVTNDSEMTADTENTQKLAQEMGCYFFGDNGSQNCETALAGYSTNLPEAQARWQHPMSAGHRRNNKPDWGLRPDYFARLAPATWHTYNTAYGYYDVAADQLDREEWKNDGLYYADLKWPTFNSEDLYEGASEPSNKEYYYRRMFWSYLLSGSGATYGGAATYRQEKTYPETGQRGLDHIPAITTILNKARIDLSQFKPAEIVKIGGQVAPFPGLSKLPIKYYSDADNVGNNRVQGAYRGKKEILAYIPNSTKNVEPAKDEPAKGRPKVKYDLTDFTDPKYGVVWYDPKTGATVGDTTGTLTGKMTGTLEAPEGLTGDAVLHISSRCQDPNHCLGMDSAPSLDTFADPKNSTGFLLYALAPGSVGVAYDKLLALDATHRVSGDSAWRCRMPDDGYHEPEPAPLDTAAYWKPYYGCNLRYEFKPAKEIASVDFYVRRDSWRAMTSICFAAVKDEDAEADVDWNTVDQLCIGLNPEGDVISQRWENRVWYDLDVRHRVDLSLHQWHHIEYRTWPEPSPADPGTYTLEMLVDGVSVYSRSTRFDSGDKVLRAAILQMSWWGKITDLPREMAPTIWIDELTIDPPPANDARRLFRTTLQQGLGDYQGAQATWFDYSAGYNSSALLRVGANGGLKALLKFDASGIPTDAVLEEATLRLYNTGRNNGNALTLGAHQLLVNWDAASANRSQRLTGLNWSAPGLGAGVDYSATAEDTAQITSNGGAWVELDVTNAARSWLANPASNLGLVVQQESAAGYVIYDFCSELGLSPCTLAQAPVLALRYHLPPAPQQAIFQKGANGYAGNRATYIAYDGGYNNSTYLPVGRRNNLKPLLRFDIAGIPSTATVDEASLRLYFGGQSNAGTLSLGAHQVLVDWTDSEANWVQRVSGLNWAAPGMRAEGADYLDAADGTADALPSAGNPWIEIDVTDMVRAWVADPGSNHGLVLLEEVANAVVQFNYCSELGWSPCTLAQAPKLTVWYRP